MTAKRKPVNFTINHFGEDKEYQIYTLVRKDAMRVMHTTLSPVMMAIASIAKNKESMDFGGIIKSLDFDVVYDIGEKLLSGAMVNKEEIDFEDYYGEHPTELYIAIYKCLQANYPDVFTKLQKAIDTVTSRLGSMMKDQVTEKEPSKKSSESSKTGK